MQHPPSSAHLPCRRLTLRLLLQHQDSNHFHLHRRLKLTRLQCGTGLQHRPYSIRLQLQLPTTHPLLQPPDPTHYHLHAARPNSTTHPLPSANTTPPPHRPKKLPQTAAAATRPDPSSRNTAARARPRAQLSHPTSQTPHRFLRATKPVSRFLRCRMAHTRRSWLCRRIRGGLRGS